MSRMEDLKEILSLIQHVSKMARSDGRRIEDLLRKMEEESPEAATVEPALSDCREAFRGVFRTLTAAVIQLRDLKSNLSDSPSPGTADSHD